MNRVTIKARFRDDASGSDVTAVIDSVSGVETDDKLWPADEKFLAEIEAVLERYRNRFPKVLVPKRELFERKARTGGDSAPASSPAERSPGAKRT